jgi:predicted RNA-binding protein with PIN domain
MILIDGHNLIPKISGMALTDLDDELRLIELLQTYARLRRKQLTVFFDHAPPGFAGPRSFGMVRAVFVRAGSSADEAIKQHLRKLDKAARQQAKVVTSDAQVRAEARALGATVITSEAFASELANLPGPAAQARTAPQPAINAEEWYGILGIDPAQAETPIEPERSPRPARKKKGKRGSG